MGTLAGVQVAIIASVMGTLVGATLTGAGRAFRRKKA
jgi:hypothetical protein